MSKLNTLPTGSTVMLLGRYRDDIKSYIGKGLSLKYNYHAKKVIVNYNKRTDLKIEFMTAHKSKGLQAEYVFIINNTSGKYGFPSNIADDKVLRLLIYESDTFEHAEERRLFYVALTRARKAAFLMVDNSIKSPFIEELEEDLKEIPELRTKWHCPNCKIGRLLERNGRYGKFYGCSNFPDCDYTKNLGEEK